MKLNRISKPIKLLFNSILIASISILFAIVMFWFEMIPEPSLATLPFAILSFAGVAYLLQILNAAHFRLFERFLEADEMDYPLMEIVYCFGISVAVIDGMYIRSVPVMSLIIAIMLNVITLMIYRKFIGRRFYRVIRNTKIFHKDEQKRSTASITQDTSQ